MGFITHLLAAIAGVYAGVYLDQNYALPEVPRPEELKSRVEAWFAEHRKGDAERGPRSSPR
ncbi:hypothetical protein AAVH_18676, partial [Aphelenchoides avenae]